ncbi:hypothetical protein J2X15_003199 [Rhodoferax saidenbachensis]|uniref:Uncharacterized protein n=1 Tax=Rhodoferax saidenbachensis TaxID=1484693 RepID=A0ABU1ZQQ9_9BURK|nr:hypothetical protein [Rhodoferax saidenbachensis]
MSSTNCCSTAAPQPTVYGELDTKTTFPACILGGSGFKKTKAFQRLRCRMSETKNVESRSQNAAWVIRIVCHELTERADKRLAPFQNSRHRLSWASPLPCSAASAICWTRAIDMPVCCSTERGWLVFSNTILGRSPSGIVWSCVLRLSVVDS